MTKKEYILDFLKEINYAYNHPAMYDDLKRLLDEMEEEILESANCISREAVMHILDEVGGDFDSPREAVVPIDYIDDMVSELPSVTAQPKMGHWVKVIEENGHAFYLCSVCKEGTDENYYWCPFCGSKNGGAE